MFADFILNGEGFGEIGNQLAGCRYDPGFLRPYLNDKGAQCVTINTGQRELNKETGSYQPILAEKRIIDLQNMGIPCPVTNATSLRKEDWILMDKVIVKEARQRMPAWSDLAAVSTYGGFDGMANTMLDHETMSDAGEAVVDMDGLTDARGDSPHFQLEGLPLPITHSDFFFSQRRVASSRSGGMPLDLTMAEMAARRVAETVEKTLVGVTTGMTYSNTTDGGYSNTPTVYGYTNYTDRVTKTDMATPDGTNGSTVLTSWLALRESMYAQYFYGPFMVYTSSEYDQYLDNLFSTTEPSAGTLRSRLKQIEGIKDIRRLDYLTGTGKYDVVFVQQTSDVARAVIGMDLRTIQWPSSGGLRTNYKVMCIYVPQLRSTNAGRCGIGHGTIS